KFADIVFELGPRTDDQAGLAFINQIVGGAIPKEFIPAVQKGFAAAMTNGPLAGYPVEAMQVRLIHGSFHEVDSDALSFELAARVGFREAAKKATPVLMEPIIGVEVMTPDEFTGAVTGDLNKRRGIMKGLDARGSVQVIKASVPLAALFGYVTDLRTITSGRASATLTFSHYEKVPKQLATAIIEKATGVAAK
ncbi:MAG: elongation factor G, partial [Bacteroidota bacterium]